MKTVVVLSDTHGDRQGIDDLSTVLSECDYIIHLGDTSSDGYYIKKRFPDKTYIINGNCDPIKVGDDELVLEIEKVRLFCTHGHRYGVKSTLSRLSLRAEELGCSIALYGHTHDAKETVSGSVTMLNPGAMSRFSAKCYLYLVINGEKAVYKHVRI